MITPGGRPGDSSPLGKPGSKRRLDDYVRAVAHALMREHGMSKGHAIAVAKNSLRRWAAGGGKVRPQVRAGAAAHLALQKGIDASLSVTAGGSVQDGPRVTLSGVTAPTKKMSKLPPAMRVRAEMKRRAKKRRGVDAQKAGSGRTANLSRVGAPTDYDLVGPKGYRHGWIYEGGPGLAKHRPRSKARSGREPAAHLSPDKVAQLEKSHSPAVRPLHSRFNTESSDTLRGRLAGGKLTPSEAKAVRSHLKARGESPSKTDAAAHTKLANEYARRNSEKALRGESPEARAERTGHVGDADMDKLARRRTDAQLQQIAKSPGTPEGRAARRELIRREAKKRKS